MVITIIRAVLILLPEFISFVRKVMAALDDGHQKPVIKSALKSFEVNPGKGAQDEKLFSGISSLP